MAGTGIGFADLVCLVATLEHLIVLKVKRILAPRPYLSTPHPLIPYPSTPHPPNTLPHPPNTLPQYEAPP
eukprot:3891688-Rhodomonas_salina.1